MNEWVIIGVPTSAGAHHAGQELAPAALRAAGLPERLRGAGLTVTDGGDLPGAVFEPDHDSAAGRNLPAVARVAREVAGRVADVAASGRRPLVLGGDCTITLGAVAGRGGTIPMPACCTWTATQTWVFPVTAARGSSTRWGSRTCSAGARRN